MKNKGIYILFLLVSLSFFSCGKDKIMRNRFLGTWNVDLYQRDLIKQSGTEVLYKKENAGYITFTNPFPDQKYNKEMEFTGSIETQAGTSELAGSGQIDDEASRWIVYNALCEGIGCDIAYTITKSTARKLEVFTISYAGTPGEHYKLTLHMSK